MEKDNDTLLQEIQARTGWSQPRMASEIGTSQPTVNRILKGHVDCKSSTMRAIVALHKKVHEEEFRARAEQDKPQLGAMKGARSARAARAAMQLAGILPASAADTLALILDELRQLRKGLVTSEQARE